MSIIRTTRRRACKCQSRTAPAGGPAATRRLPALSNDPAAVCTGTVPWRSDLADDSHTKQQAAEVVDAPGRATSTIRPTVPALEAVLFQAFPLLDHGFVRVIDYMGDDSAIVQAPRVSYGRGTKRVQEDAALIRYLMRHIHTTPFEMCEIKFHVKLPIFVARQWIRHRTANVNEYSAR